MQKSINLALLLLLPFFAFAQEKFTLSGYVKDASSGSELLGATVYVTQLKNGATTNMYGFYSLTLPKGKYNIEYSYLGYEKKTIEIDLTEDTKRDVELQSNSQQLQEVVVEAERQDQNVKDVQMSVEKLTMDKIQKIPQLLGEADVVKSIQLRPGVSTVGEGATGFNVRGGNIDQNLILLDEAPIFNSSHLFGFFSTFNPDAIKDATLYKGGIPARYGGRLSSVLDVRQREGNMRQFKGKGGIGALFSRLTLEGPIAKDKVSFLVSGRRSYADLFLKLDDELADNTAYFYDLNAKVNWKINENNRIFLSGYFGRDIFSFGDFFRASWGNSSFTARWNHLFSEKLFSNFTAFYSNYSYALGADQGGQGFDWQSNIQNTNFKADFTYYLNPKNTVKFGVNGMYYIFEPGRAEASGESFTSEIVVPTEYALEPAIYASNEQKVGEVVTLKYGLRYSHFFNLGQRDINVYRYGRPTNDADIIGSESYDQNEVIADYGGLEPRFGANILVSPVSSVKASYMRTRQYLHLVSNTTAATPLDVWKPAGEYVKPAKADQVVAGYFRNFKSNLYEMSTEVYGKWMYDLLDYKNGAELIRSFGLEFMVEKKKGDFTGWVSYTLSRTQQKVEGYQIGDYTEAKNGINNGDWYSSNWDKTHDVTVVANYDISKKWSVAANFTLQTGRPITYPMGKYYYDGKLIPNFRNRNNERLPAYHRLDLSATLNPESISDKFSYSLTFGVYNTYGRKNPYSIYFQQNESNPLQSEAVRLAIIGIPVPAVTFNFEF
jgi:hypothetical protein